MYHTGFHDEVIFYFLFFFRILQKKSYNQPHKKLISNIEELWLHFVYTFKFFEA